MSTKEYARKWRAANREKSNKAVADWRKRNPGYAASRRAAQTPEQKERYQKLARGYRRLPLPTRSCPKFCECCGRPAPVAGKALALDHDHATGKFRGWLCFYCNTAIGMLGDNIFGALCAVEYLRGR